MAIMTQEGRRRVRAGKPDKMCIRDRVVGVALVSGADVARRLPQLVAFPEQGARRSGCLLYTSRCV